MSKYIDAEILKERLIKNIALTNALDVSFSEAPTIDIIRCKDCKYCENVIVAVTNNREKTQRNICHRFKMAVDAKHFCSYGERKEQEHE